SPRIPGAARPGAGGRSREISERSAANDPPAEQGTRLARSRRRAVPGCRHHFRGEIEMRTLVRFAALVCSLGVLAACPAVAQAPGNVVKLATLVPDGSVWDKVIKGMGSEWGQATQGRVTLRVYAGGVAG